MIEYLVTALELRDESLQVRDDLDPETVARYQECFDLLPPVVVFRTPEGDLLADGFHRFQAALELGQTEIKAEVRTGTRTDAADYAAMANATAGKPLTAAERRRAILGLHERHPEWSNRQIAKMVSVSDVMVGHVIRSHRVASEVGAQDISHSAPALGQQHLVAIGRAPEPFQRPLAEAAVAERWTVEQTRQNVRTLRAEQGDSVAPVLPASRELVPLERRVFTLEQWATLPADERVAALSARNPGTRFNPQEPESQDKPQAIEWAQWSWNPVTGCKHDCSYCYARDIAARYYPHGFTPAFLPGRLGAAAATPVPPEAAGNVAYRNVFTCSMADLFGKWVPREWIEAVLGVVQDNPQWNFLFLTKFPTRLAEFEFPDNAWLGTSVDAQARIPNAEKAFARIKGGVKWLSCEPMLERLTFSRLDLFDWVVIGGASRSTQTPEFRPPREWITHLERQAEAAGCKVYEKTNLLERRREYPGAPEPAHVVVPDEFKMGYLQRDVLPAVAGAGRGS